MRPMDINCPLCGTLNRYVDLQANDGNMECEVCHTTSRVISLRPLKVIPFNEGKPRSFFWSMLSAM